MDDDSPEILVSLSGQRGKKIKDDHYGNFDLLCIYQQRDDIVETVYSSLLEVAAIVYATTTHMTSEKTPSLRAILQAQTSER